ncbi:MAG: T9SS type A sorting domain-containing protein, partial [Bacteroidetes bacterium]|nr:T9SS type A sorting domain-containing protein [Bacteroidota bacterium]
KADNTVLAATHGRGLFSTSWDLNKTNSRVDFCLSEELKVYPNPTNGWFEVNTTILENSVLSIFDANGRILLEEYLQTGSINRSFNLSAQPKGTYFIRMQSENDILATKILLR